MADYREARTVYDEMYRKYGGMMNLREIRNELGRVGADTAKRWLNDRGVPGTLIGAKPRWETRLVAKAIVNARGFC